MAKTGVAVTTVLLLLCWSTHQAKAQVTITVDYTPPPDFTPDTDEYRAASGPVIFTCLVNGAVASDVRWTSDCRYCPFQGSSTNPLYRGALTSGDTGTHTCTVGAGSATTVVNVVGAGIHIFTGRRNVMSPNNEQFSLPNNGLVFSLPLADNLGFRFRIFCRTDSNVEDVGDFIGLDGDPISTGGPFRVERLQAGEITVVNRDPDEDVLEATLQGVYTYRIPDATHLTREINVGVYTSEFNGQPTIINPLVFTPGFSSSTLTCTSSTSIATTVTFTRDNGDGTTTTVGPLRDGESMGDTYALAQTVTDRSESTFDNVLTIKHSPAAIVGSSFSCSVTNSIGSSIASEALQIVGPPLLSMITVEGPNSLSFSWDAPVEGLNPITNYIVRCTPQLEGIPTPAPVTQDASLPLTATIDGLAPGVTYDCSVAAMTDVGEGFPAEDTAMTEEIAPTGAPQHFIITPGDHGPTSRTLTFFWDLPLPTERNGMIVSYTITCTPDTVVPSTVTALPGEGGHMVEGFQPFTEYNCIIVATNSVNSGPANSVVVMTTQDAPDGPPLTQSPGFSTTADVPQSVTFSLQPPVVANGIVTSYSIYCFPSDSNLESVTEIIDIASEPVEGFNPAADYTCFFSVSTIGGQGPPTTVGLSVTTFPVAPMITSVVGVSSSAMQVDWVPNQPGINGPGAITHYTVYANDLGVDTDGVVSSYIITDLEPFVVVVVEVSASTSAGEGARSPTVMGRPNEALLNCMAEETLVAFQEDDNTVLYWPEIQIGQTALANCTCGNTTIAHASRFCGGDLESGAVWESPDDSACNFTATVRAICQLTLSSQADTGETLDDLEELTENMEEIGAAGIPIATTILEDLSSDVIQEQNRTTIETFLTVVDNLLAVDPLELKESQQMFNTSARLLESVQTVAETLSIPENESQTAVVQTSFAIAVQEILASNLQEQTFSALLGSVFEEIIVESNDLVFGVRQNATASITIPASVFMITQQPNNMNSNTSIRITNTVYANDLLFLRRGEGSQEVGSVIISASVSSNINFENLDPPVLFTLNFIKNPELQNTTNTTCNFWDSTADDGFGSWSTDGCAVVSETEEDVVCECNHLTNFAILLDVSPRDDGTSSIPSGVRKTLEALSYIGAVTSIIFLILTISTYLSSKKLRSAEPSQLLVNLCFGLLGVYMVYILAFHATAVSELCVLAGVLVHYFLLATFFSMAADAFLIFKKLIFVFLKIRRYVIISVIISWSVPAIIAVITVAPDYNNYVGTNFCRPYGIQFYIGLLVPFLAIYVFNWIMYVIIMGFLIHRYCKKPKTFKEHKSSQILQQFRNAIALSLLFGIGWALGLPATEGIDHVAVRTTFQVLFIIVTAFQGLFIFIIQCLTGSNAVEAKKEWQRWFALITFRRSSVGAYTVGHASASTSKEMDGKGTVPVQTETLMTSKTLPSLTVEPSDVIEQWHTTALEIELYQEEKQ